ncbi:GGDEF domain-containing protein [Metabacillus sp. GX 13764]|uniref:GGDEF domain-containing protein n=1 Tax=Metabacillus kandeliae TaxID=2900151 RepID=UPI001E44C7E0|nr:GGDEF domain-containing protein [Metabacillus kandeliae]MCD7035938.1 GGDEF domain-containing protein [Metabacillus kandeliae]
MKYTGRIATIILTLGIQTVFASYFFWRYNMIDIASWLGYIILFPIAWWTGLHYDKAAYYSEKDVLTNLYNRRYVTRHYKKILQTRIRKAGACYILVIDCDNFKMINDVYGHVKGDLVLAGVGSLLLKSIHKKDIASRWGGDEFLVIGRYGSKEELQQILASIEEKTKALAEEMNVPVSLSIGSAVHEGYDLELFELIRLADDHMYQNKKEKKERLAESKDLSIG